MPPLLLANICVVRGGEILEPFVYFRIKKTSSMPTLLPSYVHSLPSLQHTHTQIGLFLVKFSQASLRHKRQQMLLSPHQIRGRSWQARRQECRGSEARARHMSLGWGWGWGAAATACLAPTGTSPCDTGSQSRKPWSGLVEINITCAKLMPFEPLKLTWRLRSRKTHSLMFICNKHNKEMGLYSRVTWRSVALSWGVTYLTAVQPRLLATLLPLSLFPATLPPPPHCQAFFTHYHCSCTMPPVSHLHTLSHTYTPKHTQTHIAPSPFSWPTQLVQQQLRHEPDPTRDLEKLHKKWVLSGLRECVFVRARDFTKIWFECVKNTSFWLQTAEYWMYTWFWNTRVKRSRASGRYSTIPSHYQNLVPINPGITRGPHYRALLEKNL